MVKKQMKKTTLKVPAKINLTLDVLAFDGKFHDISSLVCRIDLCDVITVKPRKDDLITLTEKGIPSECRVEENNAFKAAVKFKEVFKTSGADVIIKKNIPVGGGVGGSSADAAGTLNAMKKAFGESGSVFDVANSLGSDTGYMAGEGAAVISGRGDKVKKVPPLPTLYLLLITEPKKCFSGEVYKKFDELKKVYEPSTETALELLKNGDINGFLSSLKNDLTESSTCFVGEIIENISALKSVGATALMTGSGSAVYGIFPTAKARNKAYKKLLPVYRGRLIKTKTL